MAFPDHLSYAASHEWVKLEGDAAVIGITCFAQDQLGDITYVDLPAVGTVLSAGGDLGSIESVKAASELYSPVAGTVIAINTALENQPELVNQDPYGAGWMVRVSLSGSPEGLMDATAYEAHTAASAH